MKKQLLLLAFVSMLVSIANAQNDGSIKGIVKDSIGKLALANVTITVLQAADSSLFGFSRTNDKGYFLIPHIPTGKYRLLITHTGYRNINTPFRITGDFREIDFGILAMRPIATVLDEVTIVQEKPPVIIKNDTIEYNAGSFKTAPNAVVEDLLKKLPGVQVDKSGKIKANGEEVKKVLVDGKEFFGNDPKMATKNLPADAIDKVQVFDRKSDQSRFTGFDDGNSEKTINLTIKPERKNGVFGKATVGGGDRGRYQESLNLNSFTGQRQLSAIGMLNNTNKQGFSFMDILNFTGSIPSPTRGGNADINMAGLPIQGGSNEGITVTQAGGLNYNNTWQKKLELMSSYFYDGLQTGIDENIRQQWLLPSNAFTTQKQNHSNNNNKSNRASLVTDYTIDTANSLRLSSVLNLQQSDYSIGSTYRSIAANNNLLNDGSSLSSITGSGYSWNNAALFRHRFAKKGRTFSANLTFNANNTHDHGALLSANNYYAMDGSLSQSDSIDQINARKNNATTYQAVLSYTEPLSKKSLLELNYNVSSVVSRSQKNTFDLDKSTGAHSLRNEQLSNLFDNHYTFYRPTLSWRYQQKKINFTVGAGGQEAWLSSGFHMAAKDSAISRSYVNFLPNANVQISISQYQNLRVFYVTNTSQPSVSQLQPIADNTDPLNIFVGNPSLKPEYRHRLQGHYLSFDPFRHTSFFAVINAVLTNRKIVNADDLDSQGVRTTHPVNVNGAYDINLNTSWGFPMRKLKSKLNLNTGLGQSRNIGFINGSKNNISSWTGSEEITWNYSYKELLDLSAGAEVGYNNVHYSLQPQLSTEYWNQRYSFELNAYLPHGFSIASDIDYSTRNGLAAGYNLGAVLWNAGLAKTVFKNKKGEFRLQVYDILGENIGISRNSNQNYIEDKSYNVLTRFFQFSFTYNLNRFAGKNIAAPSRRNDVQVIRSKG